MPHLDSPTSAAQSWHGRPARVSGPRSTRPRRHRAFLPLWMALLLAAATFITLAVWTLKSMSSETADGRETIVFWGAQKVGDDIFAVINQFEHLPENLDPKTGNPRYKVIL